MYEDERYCPKCGRALIVKKAEPDGFDMQTGRPFMKQVKKCPKIGGFWEWSEFNTHYIKVIHLPMEAKR
mgnify:CR=1 FL=1